MFGSPSARGPVPSRFLRALPLLSVLHAHIPLHFRLLLLSNESCFPLNHHFLLLLNSLLKQLDVVAHILRVQGQIVNFVVTLDTGINYS
ncbi:hypothetical protein LIPSTDRAFT_192702 [Lipomyces starkeyi NRRL Y-11557]|uniref:Uncharacterized protein n=1 Tax=Lipomyces starkeyi NRRL Y-11557 TaxID=675824 RepID=A0A1E3PW50_LIPST|nr:hypothetical protein LIPSTDRAFT_192702 [Lipomyces starkeyi NRRL Y-11557]